MLLAILSICSQEELDGNDSDSGGEAEQPTDIAARRQMIKNKILAVGKMQKVFQLLREEAENATELETGAMTGVGSHPPDNLTIQGTKINKSIKSFDDACVPCPFLLMTLLIRIHYSRRSDQLNERLPTLPSKERPAMFPPPSMRLTTRRDSDTLDMEELIKRTLDEDDEDSDGVVEKLADRIARGRNPTSRPSGLKRHGTAL